MILKQFNQHIRQAFSNSAAHYEVLSGMQYEIGRELIKTLEWDETCERILDVGMGTGKLTNRMSHLCPGAQVVGVDFADGMVEEAKKKYESFAVVQADASALPFSDESYGAVFSNLAYQWVKDLPKAFAESRRVLKKNGKFRATLFGQRTLGELFTSLEKISGQNGGAGKLQKLPDSALIQEALTAAGFRDIVVASEITKTHFDDLYSLLTWLKLIGANRTNLHFYIGPRYLAKVSEYYEKNFKGRWGVAASFEVIWIKGRK